MRRGIFCLIYCLFCLVINAIPAFPCRVQVITEKGVTFITMQGNEHIKYAVTDDGFCVVQDSVGWKYLKRDAMGTISKSEYPLERQGEYSEDLKCFLYSKRSVRQIEGFHFGNDVSIHKSPYKAHRQDNPVVGKRKALIVMMQFTDCSFSKTQEDFNALFNELGYSYDGATGSVYDFYQYASYGQLDLACDVIGPFTSAHDMAYYGKNVGMGGNDKNPHELFKEALRQASAAVTLSDYDADKDGYIDNFHIIYAGYGEEAGAPINAIWAHESTFSPISVGDMFIDRYSCAPELRGNQGGSISRIGPHCHEIGHALGAMDYYDTDYSEGGKYPGTGVWDVMASGSWNDSGINPANFNPYVKAYDFGWMNVVTLKSDTTIIACSSDISNTIYRINTPRKNDYFLLEFRRKNMFDAGVPGEGLLIFHIGPDLESNLNTNTINSTFPQNCYVVCAATPVITPNASSSSYGDVNSDKCPFPGSSENHSFTPATIPAAVCVNGANAQFSLTGIQETPDGNISFKFVTENDSIGQPEEIEIPLTGEVVWEENFTDWSLPMGWKQEYNIGKASWDKRKTTKQTVQNYMELDYADSPGVAGEKVISTSLITPTLNLEPMDYVLSYDISSLASQAGVPDTLIVSLENGPALCNHIMTYEGWETKNVIIRKQEAPFGLVYNGIVQKSSAVRLANINLRKLDITSGEERASVDNKSIKSFYTLFGQKKEQIGQGFYIVRMSDGTYKKVVVKNRQ